MRNHPSKIEGHVLIRQRANERLLVEATACGGWNEQEIVTVYLYLANTGFYRAAAVIPTMHRHEYGVDADGLTANEALEMASERWVACGGDRDAAEDAVAQIVSELGTSHAIDEDNVNEEIDE